jgi:hypothetical protein
MSEMEAGVMASSEQVARLLAVGGPREGNVKMRRSRNKFKEEKLPVKSI